MDIKYNKFYSILFYSILFYSILFYSILFHLLFFPDIHLYIYVYKCLFIRLYILYYMMNYIIFCLIIVYIEQHKFISFLLLSLVCYYLDGGGLWDALSLCSGIRKYFDKMNIDLTLSTGILIPYLLKNTPVAFFILTGTGVIFSFGTIIVIIPATLVAFFILTGVSFGFVFEFTNFTDSFILAL